MKALNHELSSFNHELSYHYPPTITTTSPWTPYTTQTHSHTTTSPWTSYESFNQHPTLSSIAPYTTTSPWSSYNTSNHQPPPTSTTLNPQSHFHSLWAPQPPNLPPLPMSYPTTDLPPKPIQPTPTPVPISPQLLPSPISDTKPKYEILPTLDKEEPEQYSEILISEEKEREEEEEPTSEPLHIVQPIANSVLVTSPTINSEPPKPTHVIATISSPFPTSPSPPSKASTKVSATPWSMSPEPKPPDPSLSMSKKPHHPPSYISFHELTLPESPPPPKPPEESCFFVEINGSFFSARFLSTGKLAAFSPPPPPPKPPDKVTVSQRKGSGTFILRLLQAEEISFGVSLGGSHSLHHLACPSADLNCSSQNQSQSLPKNHNPSETVSTNESAPRVKVFPKSHVFNAVVRTSCMCLGQISIQCITMSHQFFCLLVFKMHCTIFILTLLTPQIFPLIGYCTLFHAVSNPLPGCLTSIGPLIAHLVHHTSLPFLLHRIGNTMTRKSYALIPPTSSIWPLLMFLKNFHRPILSCFKYLAHNWLFSFHVSHVLTSEWDPGGKILVFKVANYSQLKQWDTGGYLDVFIVLNSPQFKQWVLDDDLWFLFTMAWSCQFKLWDPGKFLMISISLQP